MRNVGFVKVEQEEDECVVHIHGKGLRMGSEKSLMIYLLFESEGKCFGIWQGEADNINPAVNECISYTAEDTGTPENYAKINGLVLENRDGRRYAALWDEKPMDISGMQIWSQEGTREIRQDPLDEPEIIEEEQKVSLEGADRSEEENEAQRAEDEPQRIEDEPQRTEGEPQDIVEPQDPDDIMGEVSAIRSEDVFFMEEPEKQRLQEGWRIKKIQRTELAKLARCEWRLANNNFLLHGYYNYGHVMIDESGEEPRLGVPGNYYEREQMVAEMFGFPVFEPAREGEHITNGTFGYFYTKG